MRAWGVSQYVRADTALTLRNELAARMYPDASAPLQAVLGHTAGDRGIRRRYEVPGHLSPGQRFEHWQHWYGQAVQVPVRLERSGPLPSAFAPSALSFIGPGFTVAELRNGPAAGLWDANPGSGDLRLAYFVKAPSGTYDFSGEPASISAPRVRFLDLSRDGAFNAPAGMHVIRLNLDRAGIDVDDAAVRKLARLENIIEHPVLRSLVMPVILNCRAPGMEEHAGASGAVLRSAVTALISSLLAVATDPEGLEPSQRLAIRNYLRLNHASPALNADAVTEHFHISRRTLYSIFEPDVFGVSARIRALRTARSLELLLDPATRMLAADRLAARAGFTNSQALRRALKDTTGLGVGELRENTSLTVSHLTGLRHALDT